MQDSFYPMIAGEKILPFFLDGIGIHKRQNREHRPQGFHVSQIIFCTAGEGNLKIKGQTYPITPGISFYLPAQVPHEYYPVTEVWETHWLTFRGYGLNDLMQNIGLDNEGVYPLTDTDKLDVIFKKILRIVSEDKIYGNYYASGYLYSYFVEYYRQISRKFPTADAEANPVIYHVVDYIDKNYQDKLTMELLCSIAEVTPQHLCRLFQKYLNARPMEYIAKKRLHEAKSLLRATNKSIYEIAEETGFHQPDYFTTLFKRYENILPSEYRKIFR